VTPASQVATVAPAKPLEAVQMLKDESKTEFQQMADFSMSEVSRGAVAGQAWAQKAFGTVGVNEALEVVRQQTDKAAAGDLDAAKRMLMAQAMTLDSVFTDMMRRAASLVTNKPDGGWSISKDSFETVTRVAFKAQGQCRATLQTLGELVNPRSVAFIKQANLANGPQQVNNGAQAPSGPLAGEPESTANKLLEAHPSERLDFGAPATAGGANQDLAALGAVHGTKDAGGTVRRLPQRAKARSA
jgi:ketosteroid isomerase-like protein